MAIFRLDVGALLIVSHVRVSMTRQSGWAVALLLCGIVMNFWATVSTETLTS